MSYLEFCNEVYGYRFFSKKTGQELYKYELYASGFTSHYCFQKFKTQKR